MITCIIAYSYSYKISVSIPLNDGSFVIPYTSKSTLSSLSPMISFWRLEVFPVGVLPSPETASGRADFLRVSLKLLQQQLTRARLPPHLFRSPRQWLSDGWQGNRESCAANHGGERETRVPHYGGCNRRRRLTEQTMAARRLGEKSTPLEDRKPESDISFGAVIASVRAIL